jgi:AcrR family transcriptional regulator
VASRKRKPNNARYPGDLRRALIDAALQSIAEDNGAGVLTLRGVARRVGVSHAAPHRHFADKKALLTAVGEEGLRELRARIVAARATRRTSRARLRATGEAYLRFALEHASHYRVMFGPDVNKADSPGFQKEAIENFNLAKEIVTDCLLQPVDVGHLRQLVMIFGGVAHGIVEEALNRQIPASVPGTPFDLMQLAMDLLWMSLQNVG